MSESPVDLYKLGTTLVVPGWLVAVSWLVVVCCLWLSSVLGLLVGPIIVRVVHVWFLFVVKTQRHEHTRAQTQNGA